MNTKKKTEWWKDVVKRLKEEMKCNFYDIKYSNIKDTLYIYTGNYSEEFDDNLTTKAWEMLKQELAYNNAKILFPQYNVKRRNERYHGLDIFGIQIKKKARKTNG